MVGDAAAGRHETGSAVLLVIVGERIGDCDQNKPRRGGATLDGAALDEQRVTLKVE